MVMTLFPALSRMGYGLTLKQALVVIWAGLRGAVGLAFALFILFDDKIEDQHYRNVTFFMMGSMAAATTLLQGPTTGPLLRALGLTKPSSVKRGFLHHILGEIQRQMSAAAAAAA